MLTAGCYGYLYKGASLKEIEAMIREVYAREPLPVLPAEVSEEPAKVSPGRLCFDVEERDRLQLYCQGYDQQVAAHVLERATEKSLPLLVFSCL